jgi:hypothetical protein
VFSSTARPAWLAVPIPSGTGHATSDLFELRPRLAAAELGAAPLPAIIGSLSSTKSRGSAESAAWALGPQLSTAGGRMTLEMTAEAGRL